MPKVVEGQQFVINYHVINQGNAAASKVIIGDRYDPKSFQAMENVDEDGTVTIQFEKIEPGE